MRKNRNATKHWTSAAALVWIPDQAAYRPNRAMRRAHGFGATLDAIEMTRRTWAEAISFLLIGRPRLHSTLSTLSKRSR